MALYDKASLVLIPSGTKESKVFSQKPTNGDGDFTFSRSTSATRVNADGNIEKETQNLLLQSNSFDTTWTNSSTTETGGQSGYDGSNDAWLLTAINPSDAYISQVNSFNSVQTLSVYAKANTADFVELVTIGGGGLNPRSWFNLATGSVGTSYNCIDTKIEAVSGATGWYRCSITLNANITTYRIYVMDSDNSTAVTIGNSIYIQDAQLEQGLVARDYLETTTTAVYGGITDNIPRLDYTDSSCPALLLEPQRTNILPDSEHFGSGEWSKGNLSVSANAATSPEGLDNAYEVTFADGFHFLLDGNISVSSNTQYTFSFYVKRGTATDLKYRLRDATNSADIIAPTSYYSQTSSSEWKRIEVTFTTPTTCTSLSVYTFSDGGTLGTAYLYGAQLEQGSYATSYIPTYGSAVTRNQDSFYDNSYQANNIFGADSGSIFFDFGDEFTLFDGVSNSSPVDRMQFVDITAWGGGYFRFRGGETNHYLQLVNMDAADTSLTFSDQTKYCICWDSNGVDFYGDGALIDSTTIGIVPSINRIENGLSGTQRETRIERILFFTNKLSSQEAIDLTT